MIASNELQASEQCKLQPIAAIDVARDLTVAVLRVSLEMDLTKYSKLANSKATRMLEKFPRSNFSKMESYFGFLG